MDNLQILLAGLAMLVAGLAMLAKLTKSKKDDKFFSKLSKFMRKAKDLVSFKSLDDDEKGE